MRNEKGQFVKGHASSVTEAGIKKMKANASRYWLGKKRPALVGRTGKKGYKHTPEAIAKIKEARRKQNLNGEKSHFWKGGVTPAHTLLRMSYQYSDWRTAVFERDDYTCQECSQRGGTLNADHIKSFSKHPHLRLDVSNGKTLCESCHIKTDNFGGKANRKEHQLCV